MKYKESFALIAVCLSSFFIGCSEENKAQGDVVLPRVMTVEPIEVKATSVETAGHIMSDGHGMITDRGICWSTSQNPTIDGDKKQCGTGKGTFECPITTLAPGTTYYLKAFATNEAGTAYGEEFSITTPNPVLATLATAPVTNAYGTSAISGGTVMDDGNDKISVCGVCWSTSPNPTIQDKKTTDQAVEGSFVSTLANLEAGVTYYLRAYATNFAGTAYGDELTFETTQPVLPTVSTLSVSNITATTATTGGKVTLDGGSPILARGICWAATQEPTLADSYLEDGGKETGEYSLTLTGLKAGIVYHVRAYATNAIGTQYGNEVLFTPSYKDDGLDMVFIEGNTFTMGGVDGNSSNPSFEVTFPAYYLSKVETTQKLWVEIMKDNPTCVLCPTPLGDYQPASNVNWYDVIVFCNKLSVVKGLSPCYSIDGETNPDKWTKGASSIVCDWSAKGYRMPNNAEWEYAAGGGAANRTKYAGTNSIEQLKLYGWIEGTTEGLHEVATKLPNQLGLYDMNGNVTEYCWEWNHGYTAGAKNYPQDIPTDNPNDEKIKRGGSIWNWGGQVYMVYSRWSQPVNNTEWHNGIRLARTK